MRGFGPIFVWVACGVLGAAPVARAQTTDAATRSAARDLGMAGVQAFQHADFAAASDKLERAYQVLKVPSVGLWSARALAKLGKLVKASERYREVTLLESKEGNPTVQKQAQADATTELAALSQRIPSIVIQVQGTPSTALTFGVDGADVSSALVGARWPVDPGRHVVTARGAAEQAQAEVEVAEGESKPVLLTLQAAQSVAPAAAPEASNAAPDAGGSADTKPRSGHGTQKALAVVAGGIGVVGVAVGTVFGLQSKSKHDDVAKYCSGAACTDARGVTASKDAQSAGNVATVAMIVGGVGLAAGVTLWLTVPKATTTASLGVGPGSLQLRGTW